MKQLVLNNKHVSLGAKMVPFAGFNMPVQYEGVNAEHEAVRNGLGIFDVSHMGEFLVTGEGALELIQAVTSNDASKLSDGKIQYSCLPNDKGGIVDDLLVYRVSDVEYMLVVNASNIEKDWDWISKHNSFGANLRNISDDYCLFAIQGPNAKDALQTLTKVNLEEMPYYTFAIDQFAGVEDVIISATGYTGAGGFEIYVHNNDAEKVWDSIMKAGAEYNIKPIGLAARDTLRLEMGYCLYGNDINDSTSPIEAGLSWITKFSKSFVNSEALKNQKEKGVSKKLIGFELVDKGIPRHDYEIVNADGKNIGIVTSGTMSPTLKKSIGMGYVSTELSTLNSEIYIKVRDKNLKAKVVALPFLSSAVK
ncbi:MAG: glycine cleavage system aminomethyltransferase GcvT [Bacteroidetes bacterium]|nr:glycine cleavage system aminomethyltransferase GcvT [Bacteroidota bacterium]